MHQAAMTYRQHGTPLVVIAGKDYGAGSSRDWAAKGPKLLGIRAVLAESFERIHRSNLIGMGVLPLEFLPGQSAGTLGLTGEETISIRGIAAVVDDRHNGTSTSRPTPFASGCSSASTPGETLTTTATAESSPTSSARPNQRNGTAHPALGDEAARHVSRPSMLSDEPPPRSPSQTAPPDPPHLTNRRYCRTRREPDAVSVGAGFCYAALMGHAQTDYQRKKLGNSGDDQRC